MASPGHLPRVKVYLLNEDGFWDDRGTGHVTVEYVREAEAVRLVVVSEGVLDNPATPPTLNHLITADTAYQRQGDDTIITWTDASLATDVALSFQESRGCNYIWEQIQHIQSSSSSKAAAGGGGGSEGSFPAGEAAGPQQPQQQQQQPGSPQQPHLPHQQQHPMHEAPLGPFMRRRPTGPSGAVSASAGASMIDEFDQVTAHMGELHAHHHPDLIGGPVGPHPLGPGPHHPLGAPHLGPGHGLDASLPDTPELSNLDAIARALQEVSMFQRDRLAGQLARPGYLAKLLDIFRVSEDLEDERSLPVLYSIVKSAILLNETNLLELLFSDEYVMDVIGALEYEPDVPPALRPKHREFLRDKVVFKEVVPISDRAVAAKIHQSYRLGYVKDVVLPRALDDATFATLSSLVLFNNVEILMALHQDPSFFPTLFDKLRAAAPPRLQQQQQQPRGSGGQLAAAAADGSRNGGSGSSSEEWRDLVAFLQELCGLAKHLQASQRNALLHKLADLGLFEVMCDVMRCGDLALQLRAVDILLADVHHDPGQLRLFLTRQLKAAAEGGGLPGGASGAQQGQQASAAGDDGLFGLLMQALVSRSCGGLQEAILEMLRVLLDPESMEGAVEKNEFLEAFYDRYIGKLVAALVEAAERPHSPIAVPPSTVALIVDLLCFCVASHSYRIKYYILRQNVVEKVLKLLRRRERWLAAAAVRFLRTCLGMKDEFYNRYLVKNSLLEPVVRAFLDNGSRYNLLNSAVLEMFDFIRKENMKGLIGSVMERHEEELLAVDYCDTFRLLKAKWEQNQEREQHRTAQRDGGGPAGAAAGGPSAAPGAAGTAAGPGAGPAGAGSGGGDVARGPPPALQGRERRGLDRDEEDYFKEDSDEEEQGQQLPPSGGGGVAEPSNGRVVIEAASPLPGLLGSLVDYDDDDDDSLIPASRVGGPAAKRTPNPAGDRPGSPPLQKRFRIGPLLAGSSGAGGGLTAGAGALPANAGTNDGSGGARGGGSQGGSGGQGVAGGSSSRWDLKDHGSRNSKQGGG